MTLPKLHAPSAGPRGRWAGGDRWLGSSSPTSGIARRWAPSIIVTVMALSGSVAYADALADDDTPPEVEIVAPKDGDVVGAAGAAIKVKVEARDEESGVYEAFLRVDGRKVATVDEEPFTFESVALTAGAHTLVVAAKNGFGDTGFSKPVTITVGAPPDAKADDAKAGDQKADDSKAGDAKADDKNTGDKNADDEKTGDKKADDKKADGKNADSKKTEPAAEDKKGCAVSGSRPAWGTAGVAFALAALCGWVLRRKDTP